MPTLITTGRLSQDYVKSILANPEDREPAIRKAVEAFGGKLVALYFTTGDSDFMLITEGTGEDIISGMMATVATGMVSETNTIRAWNGAEFKAIAEKGAAAAGAYKGPGQG